MPRWVEMRLTIPSGSLDEVSDALLELGASGLQETYVEGEAPPPRQPWDTDPPPPAPERLVVKAWWPEANADAARIGVSRTVAAWPRIDAPDWSIVDDADWAEAWKAGFDRIEVADGLAVSPPWAAESGDVVIEPGMAFGTGEHPTTRACLEAVHRHAVHGESLLDVGCGTGVLAIVAALRGMKARGIDIDSDAVHASKENAIRNDVEVLFDATPLQDVSGSFDLVVANVFAEVLVALAPDLSRLCRGRLILAGVLADRCALVEDALFDMQLVSRREDGEWVCLEFLA